MDRIYWVSALAAALSFTAHAGELKRVVLDVPGMYCSLCPVTVKKALERVPGVLEATADFSSRTAEVRYDPDRASPEALAKAVTNAGYPASIKKR